MEAAETALKRYLTSIAGNPPRIMPAEKHQTASLPLFLRERYKIFESDLFGRRCYLAFESNRAAGASPSEYAQDARSLRQALSVDVILVIHKVPSYVRNRLVRQNVPFIVPGSQMFLPMLMIDLRERYPRIRTASEKLTPIAQLILIHQLVKENLSEIPLGQIALRLGYSAMAVSQAQDELQNAQLCDVLRSGRSLSIHFKWAGRDLWENAKPLLSTPTKRTHWIRWGRSRPHAATAGLTAMATYTMLADESTPTYAMRSRHVVDALEKGEIVGCVGREDAEARMEEWKYDPWILAKDDTVDPCSLYLALRDSTDERVQKELEILAKAFLK